MWGLLGKLTISPSTKIIVFVLLISSTFLYGLKTGSEYQIGKQAIQVSKALETTRNVMRGIYKKEAKIDVIYKEKVRIMYRDAEVNECSLAVVPSSMSGAVFDD